MFLFSIFLPVSLAILFFFSLSFSLSVSLFSLFLCGPTLQRLKISFHFTYQAIYVSKVREQDKHCHVRSTDIWRDTCWERKRFKIGQKAFAGDKHTSVTSLISGIFSPSWWLGTAATSCALRALARAGIFFLLLYELPWKLLQTIRTP